LLVSDGTEEKIHQGKESRKQNLNNGIDKNVFWQSSRLKIRGSGVDWLRAIHGPCPHFVRIASRSKSAILPICHPLATTWPLINLASYG
jgi:hypothetical protein